MNIHFIAIGGSVMHSLAIALKKKGYRISGSDDCIFEPSFSRLKANELLPKTMGWFPEKIHAGLDAVILGMHAHADNPELKKAQALGLPIYSFPEYIYQQALNKQRIVITGSHGKTTITALIVHVLTHKNRKLDYLLGGRLPGMENAVKITKDAPLIVIEGDEYPSSRLDTTPKALHYKHHLGVISGIAWDHINVYKTFEAYLRQFQRFLEQSEKAGILVYNQDDKQLTKLIQTADIRSDVLKVPYKAHKNKIKKGVTYLITDEKESLKIALFGKYNMYNISAALQVCLKLGITTDEFYTAISSFRGVAGRMQKLGERENTLIYRDFAHAPSKLAAASQAFKKQFPQRALTVCMELHTYSSLNKNFIAHYAGSMSAADEALLYFDPKIVALKRLEPLTEADLQAAFQHKNLKVFSESEALKQYLLHKSWDNQNILLASSGNFGGLDLNTIFHGFVNCMH